MTFYLQGSDEEYFSDFWASERAFLNSVNAKLLTVDEANTQPFDDLVLKGTEGVLGVEAMKPRLTTDYQYFCLPYELGEEIEKGLVPEIILSQLINENLAGAIYIASTDANFGCFGQISYLNADIIWNFASLHLNTPFLIFDRQKDVFALIDYDLPIQVIGYKNHIIDSGNYIKNNVGQSGWRTVINRHASYTNMRHIFDEYYRFLLPEEGHRVLDEMIIRLPNNDILK